jgi:hypothetical protein
VNGKDLEGSCRGTILRLYSGIRPERQSKTTKNLNQDGLSSNRDLNPGPLEYERVLTSRPRRFGTSNVNSNEMEV